MVLRSGDPNLLRALEACMRISSPVLLEGCTEVLDPGLEPLLAKKTFMHGKLCLVLVCYLVLVLSGTSCPCCWSQGKVTKSAN